MNQNSLNFLIRMKKVMMYSWKEKRQDTEEYCFRNKQGSLNYSIQHSNKPLPNL